MELLSQLNESAVFEHDANKGFAFSSELIPPKYKLLMSIAVSAALGVEQCINTYTTVALRKEITEEKIVEALLLARFVKSTTVFSTSTAALETIFNEGLKKRSAHNRDQKVGLSDSANGADCLWQGLIARSKCVIHQKKTLILPLKKLLKTGVSQWSH